jgi:flagellar biosynthesis protein FliP
MSDRSKRIAKTAVVTLLLTAAAPTVAQSVNLDLGATALSAKTIQLVLMLTVLSLAPGLLMMMTSFTRIVVVLSLLRNGLGTQATPPNAVLISLAMFLSFFIMKPTFDAAWVEGVDPLNRGVITEQEAVVRMAAPIKSFMLKHTRADDLKLFIELSRDPRPKKWSEVSLMTAAPAFMISELRRAFEIGFMLFLPFVIIDLVVSAILMAMGMMMLPPATISLPMKLIFFVLVDGWHLVAASLIRSYG